MTNDEETTKEWWIFYPVKGLSITDETHDLESPMFQDATIISRKHFMQYERNSEDVDPVADLRKDFQSYIAVRRTGVLRSSESRPSVIEASSKRAQCIGALLGLTRLAENPTGRTCCLIDQVHRRSFQVEVVDVERSSCGISAGNAWSCTLSDRECVDMSRAELVELINKKPFKALTAILTPHKPSISQSLCKIVEQSAISLSRALHLADPTACLLGAVTSIEILVSYKRERYDIILSRLDALLGEDCTAQYDAKSVLKARHDYVHEGEEIEGYILPKKAIGLALSSLLRYAEVAQFFRAKDELISYLDFVSKGMKLSGVWSEEEKRRFNEMLKHEQKGHDFPFLEPTPH